MSGCDKESVCVRKKTEAFRLHSGTTFGAYNYIIIRSSIRFSYSPAPQLPWFIKISMLNRAMAFAHMMQSEKCVCDAL